MFACPSTPARFHESYSHSSHDPVSLSDYIHDTLAIAPSPLQSVEEACSFWRKFVFLFTNGDVRRWGRSIFNELVDLPDGDPLLDAYEDLSVDSDEVVAKMRVLLDCAFEADPSARLGIYHDACSVDKLVSNLVNIVGELVILRKEGVHCLTSSERDAELIYQTL